MGWASLIQLLILLPLLLLPQEQTDGRPAEHLLLEMMGFLGKLRARGDFTKQEVHRAIGRKE